MDRSVGDAGTLDRLGHVGWCATCRFCQARFRNARAATSKAVLDELERHLRVHHRIETGIDWSRWEASHA